MNEHKINFLDVIGKNTGKTKEDEAIEKAQHPEENITDCPYNVCDGSGMIRQKNENGGDLC
ncbi:hypothetical protein F6Y05_39245 [Bacillus megaterium]|nr:hypothetical protein [Priestia megaterium]